MKNASAWSAVILSCAGCSSAPIHYYTLSAPEHLPIERQRVTLIVDMISTRMPRQVDRKQLVVRAGDQELRILENDEWASGLGSEVGNALRLEIDSQLARTDPLSVANIKTMSLNLDVARFESVIDRYDTLNATWRMKLMVKDDIIHRSCSFRISLPIERGVPGVVAGFQQAIRALAQAVVESVVASNRAGATVCPDSDTAEQHNAPS